MKTIKELLLAVRIAAREIKHGYRAGDLKPWWKIAMALLLVLPYLASRWIHYLLVWAVWDKDDADNFKDFSR